MRKQKSLVVSTLLLLWLGVVDSTQEPFAFNVKDEPVLCFSRKTLASGVRNEISVDSRGTIFYPDGDTAVMVTSEYGSPMPYVGSFETDDAKKPKNGDALHLPRNQVKLDRPFFVALSPSWPKADSKMLIIDFSYVYEMEASSELVQVVGKISPKESIAISKMALGFSDNDFYYFIIDQTQQVMRSKFMFQPPSDNAENQQAPELRDWISNIVPYVGSGQRIMTTNESAVGFHRLKASLDRIVSLAVHPTSRRLFLAEQINESARVLYIDAQQVVRLAVDGFVSISEINFDEEGRFLFVTDPQNATVITVDVEDLDLGELPRSRIDLGTSSDTRESILGSSVPVQALFAHKAEDAPAKAPPQVLDVHNETVLERLGNLVIRDSLSRIQCCELWKARAAPPPPILPPVPPIVPTPTPTADSGETSDPGTGNGGNPPPGGGSSSNGNKLTADDFPVVMGATAGGVALLAFATVAVLQKRRSDQTKILRQQLFGAPRSPSSQSRKDQPGGFWAIHGLRHSMTSDILTARSMEDDTFQSSEEESSGYDIPIAFGIPTKKDVESIL